MGWPQHAAILVGSARPAELRALLENIVREHQRNGKELPPELSIALAGIDSSLALSTLRELVHSGDGEALRALMYTGARRTPPLYLDAIGRSSAEWDDGVLSELARLRSEARSIAPELRRGFAERDASNIASLAHALGAIGSDSPELFEELLAVTRSRDPKNASAAAIALLRLDPKSRASAARFLALADENTMSQIVR